MTPLRLASRFLLAFAALPFVASAADWQVITTAKRSEGSFTRQVIPATRAGQAPEPEVEVFIDPRRSYQDVLGFGGAVTDSTAEVFARLKPAAQQAFLQA